MKTTLERKLTLNQIRDIRRKQGYLIILFMAVRSIFVSLFQAISLHNLFAILKNISQDIILLTSNLFDEKNLVQKQCCSKTQEDLNLKYNTFVLLVFNNMNIALLCGLKGLFCQLIAILPISIFYLYTVAIITCSNNKI